MAAYFIARLTVHNRTEEYAQYVLQVKSMIEQHGGTYLVRATEMEYIGDAPKPDKLMVIRFPTREQLDAWFESPEYQKIKPYRTAATTSEIYIVEGV